MFRLPPVLRPARCLAAGMAVLCLAGAAAFGAEPASPTWKMQYFYDKADETFIFTDITCPDDAHCLVIGAITEKSGHSRPAIVRTEDSGAHWTTVELKELPYSIFFLDPSNGWIGADKGIWSTQNGGLKWDKVSKELGIEQLYFASASHGYAAGIGGRLLETNNGGKDWQEMTLSGLPYPKEQISFEWIFFQGPSDGVLAGSAYPYGQRYSMRPDWMDPERARRMHAPPTVSFGVQSADGGKTWKSGKPFSNFGSLVRAHYLANRRLLTTMVFDDGSPWPSQVEQVDPLTGETAIIFRRKDRVAKDAIQLKSKDYVIASIEPPGLSTSLPIPGKLRMIRGHGGDSWKEDSADYRAVARNLVMAASPGERLWIATDTGMILNLTQNPGTAAKPAASLENSGTETADARRASRIR